MSNSTTNTGAVEALAERCQQRASELSDQAELCEIEAAALLGQKEARWAEWEGGKSNAAMMRWRTFLDRLSELQRNAKATREDVEHYRQCATALRATPTPASEAEVIERCARVAQNDTPQSDNPGVVHGEIVASFRIATAIRHLSPPPPPRSPAMTDPETRAIPVDVVDRKAARPWLHQYLNGSDLSALAEAFARHRITALETLAAENARLREAVEPSGDTKAAYHGEFAFELFDGVSDAGVDQHRKVYVPWDTVKQIMAAIRDRAALSPVTPVKESGR